MTIESIIEKRSARLSFRIASHVLFWIVIYSSSYFLIKYSFNTYRDTPLSYWTPLRGVLGLIMVFYPLMYWVVPRFLKDKSWIKLIGSIIPLTFAYVVLDAIGEKMVFQYCSSCRALAREINPDFLTVIQKSILTNILFKASNIEMFLQLFSGLTLPIALKVSMGYYHYYIRNLQLEKEKVQLELNFLKAQVNPHFLFNTLNNLYGLIMHSRTDQSLITLNRLSDFLRYSLENANKRTIRLSEEIKLVENYIELEKLRLNHTEVVVEINSGGKELILPPLLFIPLLENAFKYNGDTAGSKILIKLEVKRDVVQFMVQNGFNKDDKHKSQGGLGLKNLEKRLKLYFDENYEYKVTTEDGIYTAYLNLDLK